MQLTLAYRAAKPPSMTAQMQSSDAVLMVRPAAFGFNIETAATNVFAAASTTDCQRMAVIEFDAAAERLSKAGINVVILDDEADPRRPDAAFPNNWVSFHAGGTLVLYPMATPTRRLERRVDDLISLLRSRRFEVRDVIDLSGHEAFGRFLEGTGSLVLDRHGKRAYAAVGPRTHTEALADFANRLGFSTTAFEAADARGRPIYHTNVMLSVGTRFAVLCANVVPTLQRDELIQTIEATGRTIITVNEAQMRGYACNIIELRSGSGEPLLAMSSTARSSFSPEQLRALESFATIVEAAIPTIETVGGGGLRCMIADIHLPRC